MRRFPVVLTFLVLVMVVFTFAFSGTASAHSVHTTKQASCYYYRAAGPVQIYDGEGHDIGSVTLWNHTCDNLAHAQVTSYTATEAIISGSGSPGYASSTSYSSSCSCINTAPIPFVKPISAYGYATSSYDGNSWGAQAGA